MGFDCYGYGSRDITRSTILLLCREAKKITVYMVYNTQYSTPLRAYFFKDDFLDHGESEGAARTRLRAEISRREIVPNPPFQLCVLPSSFIWRESALKNISGGELSCVVCTVPLRGFLGECTVERGSCQPRSHPSICNRNTTAVQHVHSSSFERFCNASA